MIVLNLKSCHNVPIIKDSQGAKYAAHILKHHIPAIGITVPIRKRISCSFHQVSRYWKVINCGIGNLSDTSNIRNPDSKPPHASSKTKSFTYLSHVLSIRNFKSFVIVVQCRCRTLHHSDRTFEISDREHMAEVGKTLGFRRYMLCF